MFGFLKLQNCSLSDEERLIYRSHFCAVCHAMTDFGGRVSSLLTNYDMTFWLLLCSALDSGQREEPESLPCTAVPFRKVKVRPLPPRTAQTMSALNLLLIQSKVKDDEIDGESFKAGVARALYSKKFDKAQAFLEEQGFAIEAVTGLPQAQSRAEKASAPTLESLAAPTSYTLGEIFVAIAPLLGKEPLTDSLRSFGSSLGGFLYLWDALCDLEVDRKKGCFNAILAAAPLGEKEVETFLYERLDEIDDVLCSLALGPEGSLCHKLSLSLRKKVSSKYPRSECCKPRSPRRRLAKAGFLVHKQDCCDCEVDCCDCGCCDCNLCNCDPCGTDHDQCCEFNCCDISSCCCCCLGDGGGSTRTRTCILDDFMDCLCIEGICCGETDNSSIASSRRSQTRITPNLPSSSGIFERFKQVTRSIPQAKVLGSTKRRCPRCDLDMTNLMVGEVEVEECRNCGGFWLDDKEIDQLAKMPRLPHNLLNRYPTQEHPIQHLPGDGVCPACDHNAEKLVGVPYLEVPVEMCKKCHGFWLEHGVLRRVLKAKRSPKRLLKSHLKEWRCPYCDSVAEGGADVCLACGAPRPKSGFTGKLA